MAVATSHRIAVRPLAKIIAQIAFGDAFAAPPIGAQRLFSRALLDDFRRRRRCDRAGYNSRPMPVAG